ncbi:unnamed protein product, partial [Rotaria sp. Silwood2]
QMWNSSILTINDQFISTMNNIELPSFINTVDKLNILYQTLVNQYNIFLPMFQFDNKFYCRISAQIYMELSDYQTIGKIVLDSISNTTLSNSKTNKKSFSFYLLVLLYSIKVVFMSYGL